MPPESRPPRWLVARRRFWLIALPALAGFLLVLGGVHFLRPWWDGLADHAPQKTAWMAMRQAQWRERGENRRLHQQWRPLKAISPHLVQAVLIAEDDRFFRHHGLDWEMIKNALERNLDAGRVKFGASTITQQLAKNLYLSPERSLGRKLREALLALGLEAFLPKPRILELYLNVVEWGPGIFGAEAAARSHFGLSARALDAWQAARLAVLLPSPLRQSPSRLSPATAQRATRLLTEMQRRGPGRIWR